MKKLIFLLFPLFFLTACNFDIQPNQFYKLNLTDGQTLSIALENGSISNIDNLVDSDSNSYSTLILEKGFCSFLLSVPGNKNLALKYNSNSDVACNIFSQYRPSGIYQTSTLINSSSSSNIDNTYTGISSYNYYYVHLACTQKTTINVYNLNYE